MHLNANTTGQQMVCNGRQLVPFDKDFLNGKENNIESEMSGKLLNHYNPYTLTCQKIFIYVALVIKCIQPFQTSWWPSTTDLKNQLG